MKDAWSTKVYNDYNSSLFVISDNANLINANVYDYKYLIYPVITINNPGYIVVKSPNTKQNSNYMLEIGGSLLLVICAPVLSYVIYNKVQKRNISI